MKFRLLRLRRCWWRMSVTRNIGINFLMLATDQAKLDYPVTDMLIKCDGSQYPKTVTNISTSPTSIRPALLPGFDKKKLIYSSFLGTKWFSTSITIFWEYSKLETEISNILFKFSCDILYLFLKLSRSLDDKIANVKNVLRNWLSRARQIDESKINQLNWTIQHSAIRRSIWYIDYIGHFTRIRFIRPVCIDHYFDNFISVSSFHLLTF